MKTNNRTMFHFHASTLYTDVWYVGNSFNVDENFESHIKKMVLNHNSLILVNGKETSIANFLFNETKTDFNNLSIGDIKRLLNDLKCMIKDSEFARRELALEEYRKDHYPNLPSRFNSIWVANKESVNFWNKVFNDSSNTEKKRCDLYELLLNGNLFKSSDEFLPENGLSYSKMYSEAEKYWNPDFKGKYNQRMVEYLFQGNVRILKKYQDIKEIKRK